MELAEKNQKNVLFIQDVYQSKLLLNALMEVVLPIKIHVKNKIIKLILIVQIMKHYAKMVYVEKIALLYNIMVVLLKLLYCVQMEDVLKV